MQLRLGERLWILWGYLPPSILKKSFPSVCSVFSAVKHVFYSVFFVHMVVFVCPCVGIGPRKKLVKRLAVMVKGCTFALAFGKQGLVWPLRSGGGK